MALITRQEKGSKLTIQEMDGNLEYLASSSFQDGEYSQSIEATSAVLEMDPQETKGAVLGLYTNISPTGGSGTGLVVDVKITGTKGKLVANFTIVNGGTGYQVGDVVTIPISEVGGEVGEIPIELYRGQVNDEDIISTIEVYPNETIISNSSGDTSKDGSVLGISNSSLDPFTISNAATGSYVISEPETSGDGTGLEIELLIYGISMSIDLDKSTVINGGNGYAVGDELYIYADQIGGNSRGLVVTITLGEGDVLKVKNSKLIINSSTAALTSGDSAYVNVSDQKGITLTADNENSTYATIGTEAIEIYSPLIVMAGELDASGLLLGSLPTTDPEVFGQLWMDAANDYVLKVSQGE